MNFEVIKRGHVKRNILIGVVVVLILSAIILTFTKAKYRVTQSIPLVGGTINYTLADLNIVAMYLDGEPIDILPDGNYELTSESYCTNAENIKDESITLSYDGDTKTFTVTPFNKKGTKCYLYFNKKVSAVDTIISQVGVEQGDGMLVEEEGYRYQGTDPNNYIYFNCDDYNNQSSDTCETWRIIGVFDSSSHGIDAQLLKIINYSSNYGSYTWSSNGNNDWNTSTLQVDLNTNYLNRINDYATSGIKDTSRDLIEDAIWYLGYIDDQNGDIAKVTANVAYNFERNTTETWTGKIGLMYTSDYGYSALVSSCSRETSLENYGNCSSWLQHKRYGQDSGVHEWLITPSYIKDQVYSITYYGYVRYYYVGYSGSIDLYRPTLYLKEDLIIKAGDGSMSNPYQLQLT